MTAKPLALSTMYAQQGRFADGAAFAEFAAAMGYDAIEISHSTAQAKIAGIVAAGVLPISSVHAPAPYVQLESGGGNSGLNLAAIDEPERRVAVEYALRSIELAAEVGASAVVVHLGGVGSKVFDEEMELRRLHRAGTVSGGAWDAAREAAHRRRETHIPPYLEAAARTLAELVEAATPHGICLGIESRLHFHEVPHPREVVDLVAPHSRAQAGYWHDTGHVEVLDRLGLVPLADWWELAAPVAVGAHLTDVRDLNDHLAPGDGTAAWEAITAAIGHLPRYTLEINQHQTDERVRGAPAFLRSIGLG